MYCVLSTGPPSTMPEPPSGRTGSIARYPLNGPVLTSRVNETSPFPSTLLVAAGDAHVGSLALVHKRTPIVVTGWSCTRKSRKCHVAFTAATVGFGAGLFPRHPRDG